MIHVNEPHLVLSSEDGYIKGQWRGFHSGQKYRQGLEKAIEIIKEQQISNYLVDLTGSKLISLDDQNWTAQDWTPRAYAAGLRKTAIIVPKDVLVQMSVQRVDRMLDAPVQTAYFDNEADAVKWLKQK
jgi:hypothetical protein